MTAATECRTCGTEPRAGARFCDGCGAPVTEQNSRAEYKQVTVLFADVVHSMDIAAAVGAERLREIMADLADRCAAVVNRFGGTVDKFTGDGIMAVFGAPVALEDHAVRACLAAFGIQEEAKQLAVDVYDRDGVDLQLRVGLNSGEVIAGEIGSGPFGYTAVGEQVGHGATDGIGGTAGWGDAQRVDSATGGGTPRSWLSRSWFRSRVPTAPVPARRLLSMEERTAVRACGVEFGRSTVGMSAIESLLDRAGRRPRRGGRGGGTTWYRQEPLGARGHRDGDARGVEVFSAYCESHASDIAFHVVARLLRAATGVSDLDAADRS